LLSHCQAPGLLRAGGRQRMDAPPVLAAVQGFKRLALVAAALYAPPSMRSPRLSQPDSHGMCPSVGTSGTGIGVHTADVPAARRSGRPRPRYAGRMDCAAWHGWTRLTPRPTAASGRPCSGCGRCGRGMIDARPPVTTTDRGQGVLPRTRSAPTITPPSKPRMMGKPAIATSAVWSRARCPQGHHSVGWSPMPHGKEPHDIRVTFTRADWAGGLQRARCPHGHHLLSGKDSSPQRPQGREIPPRTPAVTEAQLHRLSCPAGDEATRAEWPAGVPAGALGLRVQASTARGRGRSPCRSARPSVSGQIGAGGDGMGHHGAPGAGARPGVG
jgi:hypothetical protein